ncbi:MAG: hypothetical protein Q8L73_00675 [Methylotenera sp.]|nr:hypothetical protein [Methylotenera sp.]
MTGDLVELFVWMWIIATGAFAPLGYFIYKYTQKNTAPFGEIQPHGEANHTAETQPHVEAQARVDKPAVVTKQPLVSDLADSGALAFRSSAWKQGE